MRIKLLRTRVAVYVAISFLCAMIAFSNQGSTHGEESAATWASAMANFIADPRFYRHFEWSQAESRFQPLFQPVNLRRGNVEGGRNLAKGIVWMESNLFGEPHGNKWWISDTIVILKRNDAEGHELYPLLRKDLGDRLSKPTWNLTYEQGRLTAWRKGKTARVVRVEETDYESAGKFADKGPFVVVIAGEEQGDSEEQ